MPTSFDQHEFGPSGVKPISGGTDAVMADAAILESQWLMFSSFPEGPQLRKVLRRTGEALDVWANHADTGDEKAREQFRAFLADMRPWLQQLNRDERGQFSKFGDDIPGLIDRALMRVPRDYLGLNGRAGQPVAPAPAHT